MNIDRPIFILGSGRSGTQIFSDLVSLHPDLCWISNVSMRLPLVPFTPLLHRMLDWGDFGLGQKRRIIDGTKGGIHISPVEPDAVYDRVGFRSDIRLTEADYTPELDERFRQVISRHMYWANKPRFLTKETANNQRFRLINRIFPDALFIHLIRDGRAVASSMEQNNWLPSLSLWWTGDAAINHVSEYEESIQLFGHHWQQNVDESQTAAAIVGDRYMELRYEDLVSDVHGTIDIVAKFASLRPDRNYSSILPRTLPNMNDKWRNNLSDRKVALLESTIGSKLRELGYDVAD